MPAEQPPPEGTSVPADQSQPAEGTSVPADQPESPDRAALVESARRQTEVEPILTVYPVPGVAKPNPILTVEGLRRSFGGLTAVDVDHLEIERGIVTALIGPNGAGKTTLFNLLTGFRPGRQRKLGVQRPGGDLPVARPDSPAKAWSAPSSSPSRWPSCRCSRTCCWARRARWASSFGPPRSDGCGATRSGPTPSGPMSCWSDSTWPTCATSWPAPCREASASCWRWPRALMADPVLVMLDEPMAGVNPALAQSLLEHITALSLEGVSVVFIEHDMDVVSGISDWGGGAGPGTGDRRGRAVEGDPRRGGHRRLSGPTASRGGVVIAAAPTPMAHGEAAT